MAITGKVKKAVILAGGTGGRLLPVTGKKCSKVNLDINGKPLLAYTLETLKRYGVTNVQICIRPEQEPEFTRLIESGAYPKGINYEFVHTDFHQVGKQTKQSMPRVYRTPGIKKFVANDPVFLLFGDTYFYPGFVKKALARFSQTKKSQLLVEPEHVTNPRDEKYFEKVYHSPYPHVGKGQRIPAYCGFIFTPKFFDFYVNNLRAGKSTISTFRKAHEHGLESSMMHGQAININVPADYIIAREVIGNKIRFPLPVGWTKSYRNEIKSFEKDPKRSTKSHYRKRRRPN
jgi:NDP-sugar pyrophosphorylase family protein